MAFDAEIHDVVSADGAVVDDNVPRPERNGVPLEHRQRAAERPRPGCQSLTFLTSNRFFPSFASPSAAAPFFVVASAEAGAEVGASVISTSAMVAPVG